MIVRIVGDATTTICHRYTPKEQLLFHVSHADILVVATGIPGLIHGDMIKPGCAIIDVGINRIKDPTTGKNKIVGDCHFDSKSRRSYPVVVSSLVDITDLVALLQAVWRRQAGLLLYKAVLVQ